MLKIIETNLINYIQNDSEIDQIKTTFIEYYNSNLIFMQFGKNIFTIAIVKFLWILSTKLKRLLLHIDEVCFLIIY